MNKKLKVEPIYRGEVGMTPQRYEEIKRAEEYHRRYLAKTNLILSLPELSIILFMIVWLVSCMLVVD